MNDWAKVLRTMINAYRRTHPDDPRSEIELAESLMEWLHRHGRVAKQGGKYVLPRIDDVDWLIAKLNQEGLDA